MFLLAGVSALQRDRAGLPALKKMSPYALHSLHMEVSDVGELHSFTWWIKQGIQYRLQNMKPDNKRCYMDKWERFQNSAGPMSCIQQKMWPNKWHLTLIEGSRTKQPSDLWGSYMIWWAMLKLIRRCRELTKQRSSFSCCAVTLCNKRQLLIRLWLKRSVASLLVCHKKNWWQYFRKWQ